jgi:hypothetical protein
MPECGVTSVLETDISLASSTDTMPSDRLRLILELKVLRYCDASGDEVEVQDPNRQVNVYIC